jgi:hypothetical protein
MIDSDCSLIFIRKQIQDEDSKMVETLLNDVTTGGLRKKSRRGGERGFDLSDSEDEEELLRALRRARMAVIKGPGEDVDDEDLTTLERYGMLCSQFPSVLFFIAHQPTNQKKKKKKKNLDSECSVESAHCSICEML